MSSVVSLVSSMKFIVVVVKLHREEEDKEEEKEEEKQKLVKLLCEYSVCVIRIHIH